MPRFVGAHFKSSNLGLQEDIKQKNFESAFQKVLLNILYTSEYFSNKVRSILKSFDLTEPQFNILRILAGSNPKSLSPGDIKKVMVFKRSDLTRMMDRLESKELIKRKICPENRRQVNINITESGLKVLSKVNPVINQEIYSDISHNINEKEADILSQLLDKLRV